MTGVPLNLAIPTGSAGVADMVWGEMVTENFFTVLGMRPAVGRSSRRPTARRARIRSRC